MRIVVLIKEIPDLDVWVEIDPNGLHVDPDDLAPVPNPGDWTSLRLAVGLAERLGVGSVTALLLGPEGAARTLRRCLNQGAQRAIHLISDEVSRLEGHQIAILLAEAIRERIKDWDVVLAGHDESGYGIAGGQVGTQVGALLGLPHVSRLQRVAGTPEPGVLTLECIAGRGDRVTLQCRPPLLITVHPDAETGEEPRFSTVLEALEREIERVPVTGARLRELDKERRTTLLGTAAPRPRPRRVFSPDSALPAAQRIRQVMGGGLREKRSDAIQGTPIVMARGILDFLSNRGLLVRPPSSREEPKG
jgi:electron transfer flavoprotein beta subunit